MQREGIFSQTWICDESIVKWTDFDSLSPPNQDFRSVKEREVLLLEALAGVTSVLARMLKTERDKRVEVGEPKVEVAGVKEEAGEPTSLGVDMPIIDELALKLVIAPISDDKRDARCGVGAIELALLETIIVEGGEDETGVTPIRRGCADIASTLNTSLGPDSTSLFCVTRSSITEMPKSCV